MSWGLASTVPLVDFAEDPEDLVYKYLGNNWAVTTPAHINKLSLFQTVTAASMVNRPDPGNRPVWIWVQHFDLDSARNLFGSTVGTHGLVQHNHTFNIHLLTTRLTQGLTFPDLGILSREVERLLYQYTAYQIPGIEQFISFRMLPIMEATDMGESFSGTYRVTCQSTAQYHKRSAA
jgi:hypothetical protein